MRSIRNIKHAMKYASWLFCVCWIIVFCIVLSIIVLEWDSTVGMIQDTPHELHESFIEYKEGLA